jgi:hypothetical protein
MHFNSNGITIHAELHLEPADGDLHTAIYGPTTERARSVAASAHYYCMILELQRLIAALISYGSAADSSDSGDASANHLDFGHPFETVQMCPFQMR